MVRDKLNIEENQLLNEISSYLNVDSDDLYRLIDFESNWNPWAKNSVSSARGLIQFVDSTAIDLGFKSSLDLVNKNPTVLSQLKVVFNYLKNFYPFNGTQSLYMSVFYPKARSWPSNKEFPVDVKISNPGISTPQDYIDLVNKKSKSGTIGMTTALLAVAVFFF